MDTTPNSKAVMVEIHCGQCHNYITTLPYEWAAGALLSLCAKCAKTNPIARERKPWDRRR